MEFADILSRFTVSEEQHDGSLLAVCPGHADSDPSLVIWPGENGKVRLHCRAGCNTRDIVKVAGIAMADLFDASGPMPVVTNEKPKPITPMHSAPLMMYVAQMSAHYANSPAEEYAAERFGVSPDDAQRLMMGHDPDGAGFKFTGKSFDSFPRLLVPFISFSGVVHGLQGRDLSGACPGRWVGLTNPDGHAWGKYGVMTGSGHYDAILVTEGPGDGLTSVGVGYDALIIRGAAMVNNPELCAELAAGLAATGKQIIVAGDNDKAGRKFSRTLARALREHGKVAHILEIPKEGWDLTDWRSDNPAAFPAALHQAVKGAKAYSEKRELEVDAATGALIPSAETAAEALRLINEYSDTNGVTDALCASALVAFAGGNLKYAPGLGFYVWDGSAWVCDDDMARSQAYFMGSSLQMAAKQIPDEKQRTAKLKIAARFLNTKQLDNVMTALTPLPNVKVQPDAFDSKPHLLNFKNGTVDLRDGSIRNHSPADMLTVTLPWDYNPDALCPRWEAFLEEIFPEHPEMPAYMRRLAGYGITGNVSEQCFAVLWGKGANGKSVFTDTLTEIFSGVTVTTPFSTFEERKGGGIPNDVAALKGSRLVMASEGEAGKPMSEAVLKRVTGKDKVTARFMRKEFFTFSPTFLIMLATNHKPSFRGQDEGLWRRVKMIPFSRFFAPEDRDPNLGDKLLTEAEGIIAWAVRGAMEWHANGLQDPQVVVDATKEYREASDDLQGFIPGVLEYTGSDADWILGKDILTYYKDWCVGENIPQGQEWRTKTLNAALEQRGLVKRRRAQGMAFYGVRKAAPDDTEPAGPGIFGADDHVGQALEEDLATIQANVTHAVLTRTKLPPIVSRINGEVVPGQD